VNNGNFSKRMDHLKDIAVDATKAAMPIGGGIAIQYMHLADEFLTVGTHAVGFCAAICGLVWWIQRLKNKD